MLRAVLVTTTVDQEDRAGEMAHTLVAERLAACVQVSAPMTSHYWWRDRIETATEWLLQCKTTERRLPALLVRLRALHPYEVPEILAVSMTGGDPDYLSWLEMNTRPEPAPPAPPS